MAEPKIKKETSKPEPIKPPSTQPAIPLTPTPSAPPPLPVVEQPVPPIIPAAPPATTPPPAEPEKPKKPAWIWVLVGCLVLVIISLIGVGILGWLGFRSAKNLLQKYEPTINQTQNTLNTVNQEATKWQQKSEEFRNAVPSAEEMQKLQQDMVLPDAITPQQN